MVQQNGEGDEYRGHLWYPISQTSSNVQELITKCEYLYVLKSIKTVIENVISGHFTYDLKKVNVKKNREEIKNASFIIFAEMQKTTKNM